MRLVAAISLMLSASPALAQHVGHEGNEMPMDHTGHEMAMPASPEKEPMAMPADDPHQHHQMPREDAAQIPKSPPPAEAFTAPAHAADTVYPADEMDRSRIETQNGMGGLTTHLAMLDRLEWQATKGEDNLLWDANLWLGGDTDKLWIKSEGEIEEGGTVEEAEVQALWSRAIGPWFDLQAGIRQDIRPQPERTHLVLGLQGLAPYFFDLDAAAFLSHKGDVTARIEAEYDQLITQRLIVQPRVEVNLSAQDITELGLGSGFTSLQAGLRMRYEVVREFAPYIGVEWQRDLGGTADIAKASGIDANRTVFVAGVRAWF